MTEKPMVRVITLVQTVEETFTFSVVAKNTEDAINRLVNKRGVVMDHKGEAPVDSWGTSYFGHGDDLELFEEEICYFEGNPEDLPDDLRVSREEEEEHYADKVFRVRHRVFDDRFFQVVASTDDEAIRLLRQGKAKDKDGNPSREEEHGFEFHTQANIGEDEQEFSAEVVEE